MAAHTQIECGAAGADESPVFQLQEPENLRASLAGECNSYSLSPRGEFMPAASLNGLVSGNDEILSVISGIIENTQEPGTVHSTRKHLDSVLPEVAESLQMDTSEPEQDNAAAAKTKIKTSRKLG